uniref:hypothetical protein n=1 Tax=Mucilaginibacter sp. Bleaf8 TaxID=2834430 RepID=UPI001BCF3128|nr:hypothetical protein [Mucilaginibacter sp. Bleaf8]
MFKFKTTLIHWLKKHNEYLPLLIAVLLFYFSPYALRMLDPTAGTYDVGVLQVELLAVIYFCIVQAVVWMALKVNWLPLRDYFENEFANHFKNLSPWQKMCVSLFVYFFLMFSLVILSRAI